MSVVETMKEGSYMVKKIKLKLSRFICVILSILILIPCFSIASLADSKKMSYAGYSGQVYQANVTIPKYKWNKPTQKEVITVVNSGKANIDVHIGGVYRTTLRPGKSYSIHYRTIKYSGKTISVKIQPKSRTFGTQNVKIQTTSKGNIKILGRR